jgi:hypothetical protein
MKNTVNFLKGTGYLSAFVFVVSAASYRFSKSLELTLSLYKELFGKGFFTNAFIIVTNWDMTSKGIKSRM